MTEEEVTLAVLGEKMDNLTGRVEEQILLVRIGHKDHEDRIRSVEDEVADQGHRVRQLTGIFGALQGALIAVIAWLGLR